jgi:hypothetical protein
MLKNRLSVRLLKKIQMQGGTPQRVAMRVNAAGGPFSAAC